ncbi:2'-5' RNA ligase family protein [Microlunatus ginsengisoli]|uniref:2'-5' RNA ligase family protein n=1 Tax=Microlunatus ginsengisoli TaxID=363863 RepID=A0ABP7A8W0_9ACTN
MAQSIELLLDGRAEEAVRRQWNLLADAGMPSERRTGADENHRPHVTLFAADAVPEAAEAALPGLVAELDLELQIGALMLFGPRRGRCILVRQMTASIPLLELQARVAQACGADSAGQFGPGRWSPHVTLARRVPPDRLGAMLTTLGRTADTPVLARVTGCRRWDGTRKTAWLL